MFDHFVFGGLAVMVTSVTLDPLALRRRLSPGLPLSNDKVMTEILLTNKKSLENTQARRALRCCDSPLRRPGDRGHLRDFRPVGFAPPVFTGFAFVVWLFFFLRPYVSTGCGGMQWTGATFRES